MCHSLVFMKTRWLMYSIHLNLMASSMRHLPLLFLFSLCLAGTVRSDEECVYTMYVQTGSIIKAGTDSVIGVMLYDPYGYGIYIENLEQWGGLMGSGHDYFEKGNLDIFSGTGPCLNGPVCAVNLTSDGWGPHHGWYCKYIQVTSTGVHAKCAKEQFRVEQWLATDTSPYQLWAVKDYCPKSLAQAHTHLKIVDVSRPRFPFSILSSATRQ